MESNFWFRLAIVLVSFSAIVYLVDALRRFWGFLGDLLLAVFFAWLVGSILLHIVSSLMRIPKMRRPWAILIVYLALITLVADFVFLVIPATVNQVLDIAEMIPAYVDQLPELVGTVEDTLAGFGISIQLLSQLQLDSIEELAGRAGAWAEQNAGQILQNVFNALFLTGLVIVLSFYFVLDGGRRLNEALKVLPPAAEREVRFVIRTIDETFYGYVRGMLVISLIYGVATAAVMTFTGLPAALPTAIIAAILLAVPFVGDWLALILPLLIAAIAGDFVTFLIVFGSLFFVQQVMLSLLTPRILGHAVRMPAMIVVIAVVLGARLAGIPGALLGVPVAAVISSLSVHYGMRIRRAREAREAAARAAASEAEEAASAAQAEQSRSGSAHQQWAPQGRAVAGAAPDGDTLESPPWQFEGRSGDVPGDDLPGAWTPRGLEDRAAEADGEGREDSQERWRSQRWPHEATGDREDSRAHWESPEQAVEGREDDAPGGDRTGRERD